jgi:hypothetical protein
MKQANEDSPQCRGRSAMLALAALLALLTSCLSFGLRQPPGFERVNGVLQPVFPADCPASHRYALMSWSLLTPSSLPAELLRTVEQLRDQAATELFRHWAEGLSISSAPLLVFGDDALLRQDSTILASYGSIEESLRLLDGALAGLETPIPCAVTAAELGQEHYWRKLPSKERQACLSWLQRGALTVPPPAHFQRDEMLAALRSARAALESLGRIKAATAKAELLAAAGKGSEALDVLQKVREDLPLGANLAQIGDTDSLPRLQALWEELPDRFVATALDAFDERITAMQAAWPAGNGTTSDASGHATLRALEKEVSEFLRHYRQDLRFSAALGRADTRTRDLIAAAADLRLRLWRNAFQALLSRHEYWDAAEHYRLVRESLAQENSLEVELYFSSSASSDAPLTFGESLRERCGAEYMQMLPQAFAELLTLAERAANINNKHGFSLALCTMLEQMAALMNGREQWPDALREQVKRMEALLATSRRTIYETYVQRTLLVNDMSSATPGVGLTYARDIESEMRAALASFGMSQQLRVVEPGMASSPWGYTVYGGVVANFDGKESSERQAMRTVRYAGEAKRQANPDFQPDAPEPQTQRQKSPSLYVQDIYEQVIRVREVERLAQVRVFFNLRGPGVTTLVEINEFYSKKFMQEESHPFNDVRVSEVRRLYDANALQPPAAEPTLRYDRVWTPGEMLDWARRDSLRVLALHLLYHINRYPLYLADAAAQQLKEGDRTEALELLSRCQVLCQELDVDGELAAQLKQEQAPAAAAYDACLTKLRQQREDIRDLKRTVPLQLIRQTNELLRQRRQAVK